MDSSQIEYEENNEKYIIEKILDKRRVQQKDGDSFRYHIEYYIKWKGLPNSENTWEPEKQIKNRAVVEEFEKQRERLRAGNSGQTEDSLEEQSVKISEIVSGCNKGFARGLEAKRIAGSMFLCGVLHFLMEWKDCDEMDLVPASIANKKVPSMVIDFYEGRMTWRYLSAGRIVRYEEEKLRKDQIAENLEAMRILGEEPSSSTS